MRPRWALPTAELAEFTTSGSGADTAAAGVARLRLTELELAARGTVDAAADAATRGRGATVGSMCSARCEERAARGARRPRWRGKTPTAENARTRPRRRRVRPERHRRPRARPGRRRRSPRPPRSASRCGGGRGRAPGRRSPRREVGERAPVVAWSRARVSWRAATVPTGSLARAGPYFGPYFSVAP
jgi:hypothetical protein